MRLLFDIFTFLTLGLIPSIFILINHTLNYIACKQCGEDSLLVPEQEKEPYGPVDINNKLQKLVQILPWMSEIIFLLMARYVILDFLLGALVRFWTPTTGLYNAVLYVGTFSFYLFGETISFYSSKFNFRENKRDRFCLLLCMLALSLVPFLIVARTGYQESIAMKMFLFAAACRIYISALVGDAFPLIKFRNSISLFKTATFRDCELGYTISTAAYIFAKYLAWPESTLSFVVELFSVELWAVFLKFLHVTHALFILPELCVIFGNPRLSNRYSDISTELEIRRNGLELVMAIISASLLFSSLGLYNIPLITMAVIVIALELLRAFYAILTSQMVKNTVEKIIKFSLIIMPVLEVGFSLCMKVVSREASSNRDKSGVTHEVTHNFNVLTINVE